MEAEQLARLDARGVTEVPAMSHIRPSTEKDPSLANPHSFSTELGKSCWLKKAAQHGLFPELIAGRLAKQVGAGPMAHVVNVSAACCRTARRTASSGCVGTEDLPRTENSKLLAQQGIVLKNDEIDEDQRALVVAFQTWANVGDHQVIDFSLPVTSDVDEWAERYGDELDEDE